LRPKRQCSSLIEQCSLFYLQELLPCQEYVLPVKELVSSQAKMN
jgi:hypothetical protein